MLSRSPRITGLSNDTVFGFKIPFTVQTCNAVLNHVFSALTNEFRRRRSTSCQLPSNVDVTVLFGQEFAYCPGTRLDADGYFPWKRT
jgi:hypothetical protein